MDGRCMFIYYGSLLLFPLFFVAENQRSPGRVQLEEDLIKQTQAGVEGFPLPRKNLLSSCQLQVYFLSYLSWSNRAAGHTCPWTSLSVTRPIAFGSQ